MREARRLAAPKRGSEGRHCTMKPVLCCDKPAARLTALQEDRALQVEGPLSGALKPTSLAQGDYNDTGPGVESSLPLGEPLGRPPPETTSFWRRTAPPWDMNIAASSVVHVLHLMGQGPGTSTALTLRSMVAPGTPDFLAALLL